MSKFVIGIGSQRAGSTLLHRILDECTSVYMNPVKELHYFDTLYGVRHQNVLTEFSRAQFDRDLKKIVDSDDFGFIDQKFKNHLRTNHILSTRPVTQVDYLDLFRPCLMGNPLLGEITPEYMILPEEGVKHMRKVVGADAKIILLARNPVSRLISSYKLTKVYGDRATGIKKDEFNDELMTIVEGESNWLYCQDELNGYEAALNKYEKHFNDVLFLYYKDLFTHPDKIHVVLQDFLEIDVDINRYKKLIKRKVNSLEDTVRIDNHLKDKLEKRYSNEIEFIKKYFKISEI
ncbi:sulfotransferase domain-containing protein [Halomonas binhaiensis]|uniref:Sulfotransferase n=1 Tax=Halomonas binhaiensis TaxID=2562282 RepID=A0A5C1NEJ6_9GAMM|nr:sulfotransferase domain-containing protein [Halomonas binhaiensis]QEM80119.1 sulfotransferase [Halomonas binhaiensis]